MLSNMVLSNDHMTNVKHGVFIVVIITYVDILQ